MPKLEIFQSLWAMERRRPDGEEWCLEEKFRMIAAAGYDGACIDLGSGDFSTATKSKPLFAAHGLRCSINAFPDSVEGLKPVIEMAHDFNAVAVVVNGRVFPYTPEEGADAVRGWLALGAEADIPVHVETHRLTLTNDLLYTLQLMDLVPEMELVADVSHFVVEREMPHPVDGMWGEMMNRILSRSVSFQGRVAGREQVQLQIGFPQHQGWVDTFFGWWEQGFRYWRARHGADAVLNFLCELGPPPYAITGADGYELSDRWAEALEIKARIEAIWDRLEAEDG
jgi:hypothetical protein